MVYCLACAFLGGTYLPHFIFRMIIFGIGIYAVPKHREAMGDLEQSTLLSFYALALVIIQEIILYTNLRSYAQLFIETQTNKKKQLQLENLLD